MHLKVKKHFLYYFSLTIMLGLGVFLALQSAYDKKLQMMAIVSTALFYVVWGIVHHLIHHNLTSKIVIEYILIASLGMAIVLFIIQGGI